MVPPTARPMAQLSGPPRPCHDRGRATRVGTLEHRGSARDSRFVSFSRNRANMKSRLSKMSPNRSKSSQFCNVGHKTSRMMNFGNKTAGTDTIPRRDLTHKSAVMYNHIRATRLNVKGKSLALAYCCWRPLLLFCCEC